MKRKRSKEKKGENEERRDIKKRKTIIKNEGKGRRKEGMTQTGLSSTVVVVLDEFMFSTSVLRRPEFVKKCYDINP